MPKNSAVEEPGASEVGVQTHTIRDVLPGIEMALLTGCQDRHYAFGLATALVSDGVRVDIIGGDEIDSPELHTTPHLRFLHFRRGQTHNATLAQKLWKLLIYYTKVVQYAARPSSPRIFHILWNYKLERFDRTLLMLYYKALGKKITLTAHNVNQAKRDSRDSWFNRITLKIQYRFCDHIFVHTEKMKRELCQEFKVAENAVTVIRYPINNAFVDTKLTPAEAKRRLGLRDDERAILFFGRIVPYKGIETLLDSCRLLLADNRANYRLIIAGEPKKGSEAYQREIQRSVEGMFERGQAILKTQFIPDDEIELYFKGADVLALPYKEIFQSGVLFLAYSFGLPVVATDVGSFREDIVEGSTGFLCKPNDPAGLAKAVEAYFGSELYKNLNVRRGELQGYANTNHSWQSVAELTHNAYSKMLGHNLS